MELTHSLGYVPSSAPLVLSEGADFLFSISLSDGLVFPTGTTARIVWKNATNSVWSTTAIGGVVSWRVQSAATTKALIPNGIKYSLYITYPDGIQTEDYLWYTGYSRRVD